MGRAECPITKCYSRLRCSAARLGLACRNAAIPSPRHSRLGAISLIPLSSSQLIPSSPHSAQGRPNASRTRVSALRRPKSSYLSPYPSNNTKGRGRAGTGWRGAAGLGTRLGEAHGAWLARSGNEGLSTVDEGVMRDIGPALGQGGRK